MAVEQLAVHHNTRPYARAKCDDDEVLHATCHTIDHFAKSGSVGIVRQCYRNIIQPFAEQLGQRYNAIVCPRQVRGKLNGSVIVVAVRGTNAHSLDFLYAAHLVDDDLKGLYTRVYIVFYFLIAASLNGCSGPDVAAGVDNSKHGVRTS